MDTKTTARRHHYLPQAYLAAFTNTGSKSGQFFVLDVNSGKKFCTSPVNVAVERDFNRVDIEGRPLDALENALSPFEKETATAIQNVLESEKFPNDENCNWILNLLGLIAVRNPQFRASFNQSREQAMHIISDLLVSDEKIWEHHKGKAREAGYIPNNDVTFERMKRFVEERKYTIEFPAGGNPEVDFKIIDKLLPILGQRTWSILVAPKNGPEFICSDHPVTLVCKSLRGGPIGYALKETEVFFPLGRRIGFYGVFEAPLSPVVKLKPEHVGTMNRRVVSSSERHIFSTLKSFFVLHEGQIREVEIGS